MGLLLTLLYIALALLSVADIFPGLAPYRIQLVVAVLASVLAVILIPFSRQRIIKREVILVSAFTAFAIASWLPHGWLGGVMYVSSKLLPNVVVFILLVCAVQSFRALQLLRIVLVCVTLYMVIVGIREFHSAGSEESLYVMMQNTEISPDETIAVPRLRGAGILGDPNVYAEYLLGLIPLLFAGRNKFAGRLSYIFIIPFIALLGYAIYLTKSRGALVGAAAMLIIVLWRTTKSKLLMSLAALGAAASALAIRFGGGRVVSMEGGRDRFALWSDGLGFFKSSPLWGHGFTSYPDEFGMTAHNSFVLCFSELGLIGYFLWISFILLILWQLEIVMETTPHGDEATIDDNEMHSWASAVSLSFYVFMVTAFFLSQTYFIELYLLSGISVAIINMTLLRRGVDDLLPEKNLWPIKSLAVCLVSIIAIYVVVQLRRL
jgi:hypothetical protein